MRGPYGGLAPIIILMGGLNGSGGFRPFSIPPTWPQSLPGQCCIAASSPTELRSPTRVAQVGPTSAIASGFPITMMPTTAPIPLHTYEGASHFACFRMPPSTPARTFGSRASLATYMTAFVPSNFDSAATKRGISVAGIVRTDFIFSNASCASRARAFASAVSFRNFSACVERSAIRSFAFAVPSFAGSESAIDLLVSASLVAMRSSGNLSLMPAVFIVPQVPMVTRSAPMNRTPLKISNQRLADSAESNIWSLIDVFFGGAVLLWSAMIFGAAKRIRSSWLRLKR